MNDILRTVLSLSISGSILTLILFAGKPFLKNRVSKAFSYYIWLLVLLRFAVPLTAPINIMDTLFRTNWQSMINVIPDQTGSQAVKNGAGTVGQPGAAPNAQQDSSQVWQEGEIINTQPSVETRRPFDLGGFIQSNLLWLWLTGAIVSLGWFSTAYAVFSRRIRRSCTAPHSGDIAVFERLKGSRHVRMFCSSYVATPMFIGVLHPVIVLPQLAYVRNGMEKELSHILRHEFTHYKRKDVLYKWLVVAVMSLHWFNPLMIPIHKEIGRACELSCDEAVIKDMSADEKRFYGNMLLALSANRKLPAGILATTLCEDKKELKERLLSIMKYKKKSAGTAAATLILAFLLTGCAAALGAANTHTPGPEDADIPDSKGEALLEGTAYSRKMDGTIFNWHDAGCSYELDEAGKIKLSYDGGASAAEAPLTLSDAGGVYISDKRTAIVYCSVDAPGPINLLVSDDKGTSWESASIDFDRTADWIKIGFTTQNDGWMVVCSFVGLGQEHHYLYTTADGGMNWAPVESNIDDVYGRMLSGAGFINDEIGFLCFRYETDFQPAVCVTRDGGRTWGKADITLPEEYEQYNQTPLSPVYEGENVILPVLLSDEKDITTIYLKSSDYGVTWNAEQDAVFSAANAQVAKYFEAARTDFPDYGYADWRIELLERVYTYNDTDGPALDIYRMNYQFLSEAPENVVPAGGVYVTADGWVCPTYPDSTYLVFNADTDTLLFTMMENDCHPGDESFTSDLIRERIRLQYESSGTGTVAAFADIDRDGVEETLYLDQSQMESGDFGNFCVTLRVYDREGRELWSEDAYRSHSGWVSLFLCKLDGKDYLLRYDPGMWQGGCTYTYTLFTLEGGAEKVYGAATLEFGINGAEALNPERMTGFADEVNALLKKSTLLLSSEGGTFTLGPALSDPFLETYSWLDDYPELYDRNDDLAVRLQKYSDYAVSKRARMN